MPQIPLDTNMWFLFVAIVSLLVALWTLKILMTGSLPISWSKATMRLGVLAVAGIASLLVSPNTVEALLTPFGPGTFFTLFVLSALGAIFLTETIRTFLRWTIMTVVSVTGLMVIYQFAGLAKLIEINASLLTVFIVTLPLFITHAGHAPALVMGLANLGGLLLTAYQILPTWGETTLPYWVNWQILLESFKDWRHLLVGVGAENFLAAFTAGRPASLNMTALWNTRFTLGSSLAFHIATVYGLVGAAAFGWFLTSVHPVAILALLFLPPSFSALIVVTALLILSEPAAVPKRLNLLWLGPIIAACVLLLVVAAGYGLYRAYSAELAFTTSLKALENRDGTGAYNLQIEAITKNPRITRFHTAYSQTNLALVNALVQDAATASAEAQTATQLVQQAIREAKIGVNLSPTNILAWENIASVYQSLTGVAQGADQWTVASYQKAVQLDPTNPVLRLRLGGAYVGQQKFDLAAESYVAAITLKPDYANAYYNLAFVYREQKKYLAAARALTETMTYVTAGTDDATRALKELDDVRELLTEEEKRALQ